MDGEDFWPLVDTKYYTEKYSIMMMQISISHWSLVSQRPDTNTKNLANVKRDWTKNKCVGLELKYTGSSVH